MFSIDDDTEKVQFYNLPDTNNDVIILA